MSHIVSVLVRLGALALLSFMIACSDGTGGSGEPENGDAGPNGKGTLLLDILSVERTAVYEGTVTVGNRIEPIVNGRVC